VPATEQVLVRTEVPPADLVVDDAYVYYTLSSDAPSILGGVDRIRKDGMGGPTTLTNGFAEAMSIAINDQFVFFTAGLQPTQLVRTPKDQPGADVLYSSYGDEAGTVVPQFSSVAADARYVYATDDGLNIAQRFSGDPNAPEIPTRLGETRNRPLGIRIDDEYVFWGDVTYLYRTSRTNPTGRPDLLVPAWVTAVALDATHVYYATKEFAGSGAVHRVSRVGTTQPEDLSTGWGPVIGVAVDDRAAYFTTGDRIVKVAK
jgi:hypothetical protein